MSAQHPAEHNPTLAALFRACGNHDEQTVLEHLAATAELLWCCEHCGTLNAPTDPYCRSCQHSRAKEAA
jgi:uncharacterized OB-fold protein